MQGRNLLLILHFNCKIGKCVLLEKWVKEKGFRNCSMQGRNLLLILHFNFKIGKFVLSHLTAVTDVPLPLCSSVATVPNIPLYPLFHCTLCSSLPTVPLYLVFLSCCVPLFLCSTVPSVPLYPLFLRT